MKNKWKNCSCFSLELKINNQYPIIDHLIEARGEFDYVQDSFIFYDEIKF